MYRYENTTHVITIRWTELMRLCVDNDEELLETSMDGMLRAMLERSQYDIQRDLDLHSAEWSEFCAGLSFTSDKVDGINFQYSFLQEAKLTIFKRVCKKCGRTCGLALEFCEGPRKEG